MTLVMDDTQINQKQTNERAQRWMDEELSYPWRRAGPGAGMSHLGGAPGESGWSFSPAGAPGTP